MANDPESDTEGISCIQLYKYTLVLRFLSKIKMWLRIMCKNYSMGGPLVGECGEERRQGEMHNSYVSGQ